MKRDFGLVRDILLAIESSDNNPNETIDDLKIEGHPKEEISYHVHLLHEARFIDALELSYADEYAWRPKRLTWNGCEFLDDIRDPVVWEKTKAGAQAVGARSLAFIWDMAKAIVRSEIRERTGLDI